MFLFGVFNFCSSLCVLYVNSLSEVQLAKVFSHLVDGLLTLLIRYLPLPLLCRRILISWDVKWEFVSSGSNVLCFRVLVRGSCLCLNLEVYFLFSLSSFSISGCQLSLRYIFMIFHVCVCVACVYVRTCVEWDLFSFLSRCISSVANSICWKGRIFSCVFFLHTHVKMIWL